MVDDTPANIDLLEALLAPAGYTVVSATCGAVALAMVASDAPDLILLDVLMPDMDGHEVCTRLRAEERTRHLPVVMITAAEQGDKTQALVEGADDFIRKPFDRVELLARVQSLLRIKQYQDTIQLQADAQAEWNVKLERRVADQVAELERLRRLRRFLAPQLAELILATAPAPDTSDEDALLASHRQQVSVVYCGLRGFTAFAESGEPEEVMALLHEFHAAMGAEVFRAEGTLGRFDEDGLLVYFNDPLPCAEPAAQAVRMVLAMRDRAASMMSGWRRNGHELAFIAGVTLGYATLGEIGCDGRLDYGPVGPIVKLAFRLADEAKPGQILTTGRVQAVVESIAGARPVGELALRGYGRPVQAYEIDPPNPDITGRTSAPGAKQVPGPEALSPREREVAAWIASGLSSRELAEALVIAEGTADRHVANILAKLGFRSRIQLAAWAVQQGLTVHPRRSFHEAGDANPGAAHSS